MCFSAPASFTAAAFLTAIGVYGLTKIKDKRLLLIAIIPFIFAFQQIVEGVLWTLVDKPEEFAHFAALEKYWFLFVAFLVWPIWIPLSIYVAESDPKRKKLLSLFVGLGILYELYVLYVLFFIPGARQVDVQIMGRSIQYNIFGDYDYATLLRFMYYAAVIVPPFLSSIKYLWLFGLAIFIGLTVSLYFYSHALISVWCFFAAALSICLYFVLREKAREIISGN